MADVSLAACIAEIKANPDRFYVYVLSKPDGEPFYVGCAVARRGRTRHRILDHEMFAKRSEQSLRASIIRKIWAAGRNVHRSIDSWHDSQEPMFAREMELIAQIGRRDLGRGPLANGNDGGTGAIGLLPETIAKMKRHNREKWTLEARQVAAERARAHHVANPDHRRKMGAGTKRYLSDEGNWQKFSARMKELAQQPEHRARYMETFARVLSDPEKHAARNRKRAVLMRDENVRSAISESVKALWTDPEFRERGVKNLAEMNRKAWSNPASRAKHKAAQKARREREKEAKQS